MVYHSICQFRRGTERRRKKTLFRQAATPATFLIANAQLLSELSLEHSRNLSTFSRRTTGHGCFTPWRIANFVASFITPMARGWEGVEYTTLCSSHRKHEAEEGRTRNPMFPLSWELFFSRAVSSLVRYVVSSYPTPISVFGVNDDN